MAEATSGRRGHNRAGWVEINDAMKLRVDSNRRAENTDLRGKGDARTWIFAPQMSVKGKREGGVHSSSVWVSLPPRSNGS